MSSRYCPALHQYVDAASASSYSCFVMQLLSGSFPASVKRSHPLQLRLRGFMCATKCPRWSLK